LNQVTSIEKSSAIALIKAKVEDYKQLFKFRLNLVVVFSSVVGYVLAAGLSTNWLGIAVLTLGGFLVTASANAINQIFEVDYDKMMKRTANRPLPTGRMKSAEAILAAGLSGIAGVLLLGLFFNMYAAIVAAVSLFLYTFIYTPVKRISPISVFIGAIPGALPPVIGWVAFTGSITIEAIILFTIQFIWQFPHFWAIGWVGYDDYKKAGFKMLPSVDGKSKFVAMQSIIYVLVLIPIALIGAWFGIGFRVTAIMSIFAGILYLIPAIKLYRDLTDKAALKLMFASFLYLPLMQISWLIDCFWI